MRLSKYTDASTSPEVQTDLVEGAATAIGGDVIGWATDVDVSALKTTPWEREQLAYWLERPDEWDVLVWQRMDRAVRSMADMADLGRYAKKHGKRLLFASGPGGGRLELDFSSPMSELIMLILAFAAQLEGQTIMERNKGTADHLQAMGRWAGGIIPYGFIPVRKTFPDGNEGWWLGRDVDTTWNHVLDMVARAIEGTPYTQIRDHFNETGVMTPKNHRNRLATPPRKPDPKSVWRDTTIRDILLSPTLRGYLVRDDGSIVRDAKGEPVRAGEALVDDETWHRLQAALKERAASNAGVSKRKDAHPLLGVVVCQVCFRNLYAGWVTRKRVPEGERRRGKAPVGDGKRQLFRCKGAEHPEGVAAPNIEVDATVAWVDEKFREHFRHVRRTMEVKTGGVDNRPAIAELKSDIEALGVQMVKLRGAAADMVAQQLNGMSDTLAKLEKTPFIPAQTRVVDLPGTWADAWDAADDWAERRAMLLQLGVRVIVGPPTGRNRPVGERLTFHVGTHVDPERDALEDAEYQARL
ncbi:recombinase family protein [Streptomyces sp. NPDC088733]|uniref:recombinase family protein n=1 Tax=Streptomyces sp. NPDC088733 TaxID=3365880 RepID=UPI0038047545